MTNNNTYPFDYMYSDKNGIYRIGQSRISADNVVIAYELAKMDCESIKAYNKPKDNKKSKEKFRFFGIEEVEGWEYDVYPQLGSFGYDPNE